MTPESGPDRIDDLQKKRADKLGKLALRIRRSAGGNHKLHILATSLQDAALLEEAARTLSEPHTKNPERQPIRENPHYNPDVKAIPF